MSLAVVITDTFGRVWRRGLVNVAIGCAGLPAIVDLRGTTDHEGKLLEPFTCRSRMAWRLKAAAGDG